MDTYVVEKYHPPYKEDWDDFVIHSKNATFLFQRDFMEYHHARFEDFSLMIYRNQSLVALLPAHKVGNALHSHQGLTYGGLVLAKNTRFEVTLHSFTALLEFLCAQGIITLYIKEIPAIYCLVPSNELSYFAFVLKAQLYRRDVLSVIENQYKQKYSKSRREGIKRGENRALEVLNDDAFELFWNQILKPNLKHKHGVAPVHSLDEILYLKRLFPENIKQYNVYHDGQIVAGTTVFETRRVAHCQYISGNSDKNNLGSLDILHAHLIDEVYANKDYFDFGSSNDDNGQTINKGLQFWKEGFGARSVVQDFYKFDTKNYVQLKNVLK